MRPLQHSYFYFRIFHLKKIFGIFRNAFYCFLGMRIGKGTFLPKVYVTCPNKVSIGIKCILEQGIYFKFDGYWSKDPSIIIGNNIFIGANCEFNIVDEVRIEDNCLIASGCRFIDHNHGTNINELMRLQPNDKAKIHLENNVWLGCNVVILKGVVIGANSIVAAGAVVTKSIPANEIWAGVPAKKIGERS